MKQTATLVCVINLLVFTVHSSEHSKNQQSPLYNHEESLPGRYIVKLKNGIDTTQFAKKLQELYRNDKTTAIKISDSSVWNNINGMAVKLNKEALTKIQWMEEVEYIESDVVLQGSTADDPAEWNLDELDGKVDQLYNPAGDGSGTDVFILDSGINYTLDEFGGRAQFGGIDFVDPEEGDGSDHNGHGTYVASLVAGKRFGVAKGANIYSLRILDSNKRGSTRILINALNYVEKLQSEDRYGRIVVLLALSTARHQYTNEVIKRLTSQGIVIVTAAGNNAMNACNYTPGSADGVINVGAGDSLNKIWYYSFQWTPQFMYKKGSNYGDCVDLFARGKDIKGASKHSHISYEMHMGTSTAASQVAGAAAVLLQVYPDASPADIKTLLINYSTRDSLNLSTIPLQYRLSTPNRLLQLPAGNDRMKYRPGEGNNEATEIGTFTSKSPTLAPKPTTPNETAGTKPQTTTSTGTSTSTASIITTEEPSDLPLSRQLQQAADGWTTITYPSTCNLSIDFEEMKQRGYVLHQLHSLPGSEQVCFLAIFARQQMSDSYKGFFNLTFYELQYKIQTGTIDISRVYILQGTRVGTETLYNAVQGDTALSTIVVHGFSPLHHSRFLRLMYIKGYSRTDEVFDHLNGNPKTLAANGVFRKRGDLDNSLYYKNIRPKVLKQQIRVMQKLGFSIIYLQGYRLSDRRGKPDCRLMAGFTRGVKSFKITFLRGSERLQNKNEFHRNSGYHLDLVVPYQMTQTTEILNYAAIFIMD